MKNGKKLTRVEETRLRRKEKIDRVLKPVRWVVSGLGAVLTFMQSRSVSLSIFVFVMLWAFVLSSISKLWVSGLKWRRLVFTTILLGLPTLILHFSYQLWAIMWLSVVLGLVLGVLLTFYVIGFFFQDILDEDSGEILRGPLAEDAFLEIRNRFSDDEWRQIRLLPIWIFYLVSIADKRIDAAERDAFARDVALLDRYRDPLLRAMLAEIRSSMLDLDQEFDLALGDLSFEHVDGAWSIIAGELSHQEYIRFGKSLATAMNRLGETSEQSGEKLETVFRLMQNYAEDEASVEELFFELGFGGMIQPRE